MDFLHEVMPTGRLTRAEAGVNRDVLAVAYKVQGKKISRRDAIRNMSTDLAQLKRLTKIVDVRLNTLGNRIPYGRDAADLNQDFDEIKGYILTGEDVRNRTEQILEDLSDDPVFKVIYPSDRDPKQEIWFPYKTRYYAHEHFLRVDGQFERVDNVHWLSEDQADVTFGSGLKVIVSPLEFVNEVERVEEICPGDSVILAGQYVIVGEVERASAYDQNGTRAYLMTNYLKIISVDRGENAPKRRGRNQKEESDDVMSPFFFR